jgi:indolepyruvate ferredoxin oxidoreductase
MFSKKDSNGHLIKKEYGAWIWTAFKVLAKFKALRGTPLDIFGYTDERRAERKLSADYQAMVLELCQNLTVENLPTALALANLPEHVRGYGHIKDKAMHEYYQQVAMLRKIPSQPIDSDHLSVNVR